jgi:hypothetical protein
VNLRSATLQPVDRRLTRAEAYPLPRNAASPQASKTTYYSPELAAPIGERKYITFEVLPPLSKIRAETKGLYWIVLALALRVRAVKRDCLQVRLLW